MRDSPIALIEFHWLPSATARARKAAAPRRRPPPAPTTGGYRLPGGGWRAFVGDGLDCGAAPIVFLHLVPEVEEPPAPRATWHRLH